MPIPSAKRWRLLLVPAAAMAAMSPVSFSLERGFVSAEACADGTCCTEEKSLCMVNGLRIPDAYFKSSGSCVVSQT